MFLMLFFSYYVQTISREPKSGDYILVKDYRDKKDATKKLANPRIHILNKEFKELWPTGDLFEFESSDGFGPTNAYKNRDKPDTALTADDDFTAILVYMNNTYKNED